MHEMQFPPAVCFNAKRKLPAYVKAEVSDIAILNHIILTLKALQALFGRRREGAAAGHEVVEAGHFGTDEAALDVGVDLARRFGSFGASGDGPGPHLVLAGGPE